MTAILTFIETSVTGDIQKSAAGLLGAASKLGTPVAVVAVRPGAGGDLVAKLGDLGAVQVFVAESDAVGQRLADPQTAALEAAVEHFKPEAILLSHTVDGRETAGRLAIRIGSGLCLDVIDVTRSGDDISATHSVFGGAYVVESTVDGNPAIISVRHGAIEHRAEPVVAQAVTEEVTIRGSAPALIKATAPAAVATGRPELRDAARVVAGGRGLSSKANFSLVEELADVMGAAVGYHGPPSMQVMCRITTRWARPALPFRRRFTSHWESPARFSTGLACKPPGLSSPSTRTRTRRSSTLRTSEW